MNACACSCVSKRIVWEGVACSCVSKRMIWEGMARWVSGFM